MIFRDREGIKIGKIVEEAPKPSTPEVNDGELDDSDTENVDGDVNQNNEKVLSIPKDFDSTESMNAPERISEEIDDSSDPSELYQEMIMEERLELIDNDEDESLDSIESPTDHFEEPLKVDETNIEEETTTEVESQASRHGRLRPKKPVSYDHRHTHTMEILLYQMSVGNILKLFGDRAGDAVTKKMFSLMKKVS